MTTAAVVVTGAKVALPLVTRAAAKLTRRLMFRRRVYRRVRKGTDLACNWRVYRAWLKTLSAQELAQPVEDVQALLALRLDTALLDATGPWGQKPTHLSQALDLTQSTYPAIVAAMPAADRVALKEHWTQSRSARILDGLFSLAGPDAALSPTDLAKALRLRSETRRDLRLQAFGLDASSLGEFLDAVTSPITAIGQVTVLVGDFGAGKSEAAEIWHRQAIDIFERTEDAQFPIWISARDVRGTSLELMLNQCAGVKWRSECGVRLVLDGVDELEPGDAQHVLGAARLLVKTLPKSEVLATARPGAKLWQKEEQKTVTLLDKDAVTALISTVAGAKVHGWTWTAEMKATLSRPFFALAAGTIYAKGDALTGEVDLIRSLVETALERPNESGTLASEQLFGALKELSVHLTRSGNDGLTLPQRQVVIRSRLVAEGSGDAVRFALPILQHWFAAQAILDDRDIAAEVVVDASRFGRWRWAAAVAISSATNDAAADSLVEMWVRGNPGAAAWVLNEAFGQSVLRTPGKEVALDAATSGPRLLHAFRTWAESLGPSARGLVHKSVAGGPVTLGISVRDRHLSFSFASDRPDQDALVADSEDLPGIEWQRSWSGDAPRGRAWPWVVVRNDISNAVVPKLNSDPFLGHIEGVWVAERRYDLARRIGSNKATLFRTPVDAVLTRELALGYLSRMGGERSALLRLQNSPDYSAQELVDLVAWIEFSGMAEITSPVPGADLDRPTSGLVWDFYSDQGLMMFEAEVFGLGCAAYDEALDDHFACFGWSMSGRSKAPFGVAMDIDFAVESDAVGGPIITAMRIPMDILDEVAAATSESIWSTNGRTLITPRPRADTMNNDRRASIDDKLFGWLAERETAFPMGVGRNTFGPRNVNESRPACGVAANWLWRDFQTLGLGRGAFPQLR